jgi:hypothetical protein
LRTASITGRCRQAGRHQVTSEREILPNNVSERCEGLRRLDPDAVVLNTQRGWRYVPIAKSRSLVGKRPNLGELFSSMLALATGRIFQADSQLAHCPIADSFVQTIRSRTRLPLVHWDRIIHRTVSPPFNPTGQRVPTYLIGFDSALSNAKPDTLGIATFGGQLKESDGRGWIALFVERETYGSLAPWPGLCWAYITVSGTGAVKYAGDLYGTWKRSLFAISRNTRDDHCSS